MTDSDELYDLEPDHSAANPLLRRIKDPQQHHEVFDCIMRSTRVVDSVADVVGPDVRFVAGKLNLKHPAGGAPVEWHQDHAFGPSTNTDGCTVAIALDDSDEENGCLLFVPGSHRGPVHDHHQDGHFVGAVAPDLPALAQAVALPVRAGSASMHHLRALHASAPNRSARSRRLLLFQYAAADNFLIGPVENPGWHQSLDDYDRYIVRGRASPTARLEGGSILLPRYEKHDSIYALQESSRRTDWAVGPIVPNGPAGHP